MLVLYVRKSVEREEITWGLRNVCNILAKAFRYWAQWLDLVLPEGRRGTREPRAYPPKSANVQDGYKYIKSQLLHELILFFFQSFLLFSYPIVTIRCG